MKTAAVLWNSNGNTTVLTRKAKVSSEPDSAAVRTTGVAGAYAVSKFQQSASVSALAHQAIDRARHAARHLRTNFPAWIFMAFDFTPFIWLICVLTHVL